LIGNKFIVLFGSAAAAALPIFIAGKMRTIKMSQAIDNGILCDIMKKKGGISQ